MPNTIRGVKMRMAMLFILVLIVPLASAEAFNYYQIALLYDFGELSIKSINVKPLSGQRQETFGEYMAQVITAEGMPLNLTFFAFPQTIRYDAIDPDTGQIAGGGELMLNKTEITLLLPYYDNAARVEIKSFDKGMNQWVTMSTIDVSDYSRLAELPAEKHAALQEKVEAREQVVEKERVEKEEVVAKKRTISGYLMIAAVFLVLVILTAVIMHKVRKRDTTQR